MIKLLIFQNALPHYRIDFYNELSKRYEVYVVHSGVPTDSKKINFKEIVIKKIKFGSFSFQKGIFKVVERISPDKIISMFDITHPSPFILLLFKKYRKIFIWWGLDKGRSSIALKIKLLFAKLNIPIIFYHREIKKKFVELGVPKKSCFIGNNTFHVEARKKAYKNEKNYFLFVGTLDKRKGLDICINAFKKVTKKYNTNIKFIIIGDGDEYSNLLKLVSSLKLEKQIGLIGRINNTDELARYYENAIASVSYGQAGLSVLQSFAYGVPYITCEDAISGGEHKNIVHKVNGLLFDNQYSIEDAMHDLILDKDFTLKLGKNAYNYYSKFCTIEEMAKGFHEAINLNE
jgi:glycosyltransferase involved in cell wall biosynthesis